MRLAIDPREGLRRLFAWKIRGIRWIDILAGLLLGAMIFSVYLAKAGAQSESARIAELEGEISANAERVRLLRAEVAQLETPARLDALSRGAGLGPVDARRQANQGRLNELAPVQAVAPAPVVATPAPTPDEAVDPTAPTIAAPTIAAVAIVREEGR